MQKQPKVNTLRNPKNPTLDRNEALRQEFDRKRLQWQLISPDPIDITPEMVPIRFISFEQGGNE